MSQQKLTALCLLDLSAAFDTIDHSILIHHLSSWFGFNGRVLSWLKSYLSSRHFAVNINSTLSAQFSLHHGVPQGSVLGPLLFILFTISSHAIRLFLTLVSVIIYMLMTLNCSSLLLLLISPLTLLIYKLQLTSSRNR